MIHGAQQGFPTDPLLFVEDIVLSLIPGALGELEEGEEKEMRNDPLLAGRRFPILKDIRERLAELGDSIAGTLIAAIAALSEFTAITFCDRVFWRI